MGFMDSLVRPHSTEHGVLRHRHAGTAGSTTRGSAFAETRARHQAMIRPFALFLAVGFLSAAAFLLMPDNTPGPPASAGSTPRVDADHDAAAYETRASLACAPAHRAPAHASVHLQPRRYDDVVPKEEFVLDVVREDGRPMAGAEVRFVNQGLALEAVTDVNGRLRIEAQPETSAFVTVKRADCYPHTDVLALEPGLRRLVVPNKKTVVARVLVRGQTPREPIRIGYQLPFNLPLLSATADAQGRVEFFNLPQNVEGTFTWPEGYRRDDARGFQSARLPTEAEWTRAVVASVKADVTSITVSGNFAIKVQATVPTLTLNWAAPGTPVPAAAHPEGGPAFVGEVRVEGNVNTLNRVLTEEMTKALEESIDTLLTRPKGQNDSAGHDDDVMKLVLGSATALDGTEIRLIPTRTLPIKILDPSGAPVAAYVSVTQGWCSFNANPFEIEELHTGGHHGGATLTLDEDVYASGLSSVIEVHWSSTGVLLPLENVSMTWNAAGAPSATVTVAYPPAVEPVVVESITDDQK